jgi:hypothetical protein
VKIAHRRTQDLLLADSVRLSPVLLEVLNSSGVQLEDLISLVLVSRGHLVVLPGTPASDQLLTALPVRSSICSYSACLDMALPSRADGTHHYCEADTLPFMVLPEPLPEPEVVVAMRGRRLSLAANTHFAALRCIDPPIESARIVRGSGGATLDLVLDMKWISVPVRRSLRILRG